MLPVSNSSSSQSFTRPHRTFSEDTSWPISVCLDGTDHFPDSLSSITTIWTFFSKLFYIWTTYQVDWTQQIWWCLSTRCIQNHRPRRGGHIRIYNMCRVLPMASGFLCSTLNNTTAYKNFIWLILVGQCDAIFYCCYVTCWWNNAAISSLCNILYNVPDLGNNVGMP